MSRKKDGNEEAKKRKMKGQGEKKGRSGDRGGEREEERNTDRKEVKSVNEKYLIENPSSNWALELLLKGLIFCT